MASPAPARTLVSARRRGAGNGLLITSLMSLLGCRDSICERFNLNCEAILISEEGVDEDGDVWQEGDDCDDTNPEIHPFATELCNSLDDDCDGEVDEGADGTVLYSDLDGDGHGDPNASLGFSCIGLAQSSPYPTDCDDTNSLVNPDAEEICDEIDQDCNGIVDDPPPSIYYQDEDGDGYVIYEDVYLSCPGVGWVTTYEHSGEDCDDSSGEIYPGAAEVCNSVDDDCDSKVDAEDRGLEGGISLYLDDDGDGYGDDDGTYMFCEEDVPGYSTNGDDCDDDDSEVHPDALEVCDGKDNDCNHLADTGDPTLVVVPEWWQDLDEDGYGDPSVPSLTCGRSGSWAENDADCDDTDVNINPGASETDCEDLVDRNCDGSSGSADLDGDGWAACQDCDDADPARSPDATEVCDAGGLDEDCDGLVQDDDPNVDASGGIEVWPDADGDGEGDSSVSASYRCAASTAWVISADDCDDNDSSVSPSATEICNAGLDRDCDGVSLVCAWAGDHTLGSSEISIAPEGGTSFGGALGPAGDVDGDGLPDVVIGDSSAASSSGTTTAGKVFLFSGADLYHWGDSSAGAVAVATVEDDTTALYLGSAVSAAGDQDEDGYGDLLVAASGWSDPATHSGAVLLFPGPLVGALGSGDATWRVEGSTAYEGLGAALLAEADINGDGTSDLAVGAPTAATGCGAVYLFFGPLGDQTAPDATLPLTSSQLLAGTSLAAGDTNGDGLDELLIGAPGSSSASAIGGVYLLEGPTTESTSLSDASLFMEGASVSHSAGQAVISSFDLDEDGLEDVLIGAPGATGSATKSGVSYLFLGGGTLAGATGTMAMVAGDGSLLGSSGSDYSGYALASPGDLDGDTLPDVVVGGYGTNHGTGSDTGCAWIVSGLFSGSTTLSSGAVARVYGVDAYDSLAQSLSSPGDLNGDNNPDLLLGALGQGSHYEGAAWLLFGVAP